MLVFSLLPSLGYSLLWWKVCYQDEMGVFRGRTKAWRVTPLCLFQIIWQEWKRKSFDRMQQPDLSPKNSFFCSLSWVLFSFSSWSFFFYILYIGWIVNSGWVGVRWSCVFVPSPSFSSLCMPAMYLGCAYPFLLGMSSLFLVLPIKNKTKQKRSNKQT